MVEVLFIINIYLTLRQIVSDLLKCFCTCVLCYNKFANKGLWTCLKNLCSSGLCYTFVISYNKHLLDYAM